MFINTFNSHTKSSSSEWMNECRFTARDKSKACKFNLKLSSFNTTPMMSFVTNSFKRWESFLNMTR